MPGTEGGAKDVRLRSANFLVKSFTLRPEPSKQQPFRTLWDKAVSRIFKANPCKGGLRFNVAVNWCKP